MFSLVFSKFLAMRNITLYTVYSYLFLGQYGSGKTVSASEVVKIKLGMYNKKGFIVDVIVVAVKELSFLIRLCKMLEEKWFVDIKVTIFKTYDELNSKYRNTYKNLISRQVRS